MCGRDAHVCRNCRHHDPGAHHECREVQAEWVKYKDQANFCSEFAPSQGLVAAERAVAARSQLDQLFGGTKVPGPSPAGSVSTELAQFLATRKA